MSQQKVKYAFMQSPTTIVGLCTSETRFRAEDGYNMTLSNGYNALIITKANVTAIVPMANVKAAVIDGELTDKISAK